MNKESLPEWQIWDNQLTLEEWNIRSIPDVWSTIDWLALYNHAARKIGEQEFADALSQIDGIERIKTLHVHFNSLFTNLTFLRALPGVERLLLHGGAIQSLDGIELAPITGLQIDTWKNRKRDISNIAETRIRSLALVWANLLDLEAIAQCGALTFLQLTRCPQVSFDRWQGIPLETFNPVRGDIYELVDTAHINSLRTMHLYGCRKLERFGGDNSGLTGIILECCQRIDLHTLATCPNLEYLTVVTRTNEVPLSAFTRLPALRSLSLMNSVVTYDRLALKETSPNLERIHILRMKKDELIKLSEHNPGVLVNNGNMTFRDGVRVG